MSAPPVDPLLHRDVRDAVVLCEPHFRALQQFADVTFPHPTETAQYHLDLARLYACFFGAQLEQVMQPRRKRNVDLPGYQAELSLLALGQTIGYLADLTGNRELLDAPNGAHLVALIAARQPDLARPLQARLDGRDRVSVESMTAAAARGLVKRNKLRTKIDQVALEMVIPSALVATRNSTAAHVHRTTAVLLAPIMTDDPAIRL